MTTKYQGHCHCGAVRFEVELDPAKGAGRCNCSICIRTAATSAIVKPAEFKLLSEQSALSSYQWGAQISTRYFCKTCGVHCFAYGHLEQLGGDYVSVNLNCIDAIDATTIPLVYWDGQNNNWAAGPRQTPWPRTVAEPMPA